MPDKNLPDAIFAQRRQTIPGDQSVSRECIVYCQFLKRQCTSTLATDNFQHAKGIIFRNSQSACEPSACLFIRQ